MGRRNESARQRNAKGRLNRREKGGKRVPHVDHSAPPRVELSDLVLPAGRCMRNPRRPKDIFATEADAARALEQAQRTRQRMGSGHAEKRYYLCWDRVGTNPDGTARFIGCKGYHLTSRTEYDPIRRMVNQ